MFISNTHILSFLSDLGPRFASGEQALRSSIKAAAITDTAKLRGVTSDNDEEVDQRDLDWSTVLKRTFESYVRGDIPNMYGEWLQW
jgi:DDB1- and CUL4-associated factor 13